MPPTSNLNYVAGGYTGDARGGHAVRRRIDLRVHAWSQSDVLVDVTGSYSTDPVGFAVPSATTDTHLRLPAQRRSVGEPARHGPIAVPAGAAAVAINVTVTEPAASGFVTVFPCQADSARRVEPQLRRRAGRGQPGADRRVERTGLRVQQRRARTS